MTIRQWLMWAGLGLSCFHQHCLISCVWSVVHTWLFDDSFTQCVCWSRALPRPGPSVGHGMHGGLRRAGQYLEAVLVSVCQYVTNSYQCSLVGISYYVASPCTARHQILCALFVKGQTVLMPNGIAAFGKMQPCTELLQGCGVRGLTWPKPSK